MPLLFDRILFVHFLLTIFPVYLQKIYLSIHCLIYCFIYLLFILSEFLQHNIDTKAHIQTGDSNSTQTRASRREVMLEECLTE